MPTATLKLIPGVDTNRTQTLNEAAISSCNLIRFVQDRQGIALPQKLGGWTTFFNQGMPAIPRVLNAWQDDNGNQYLGIGCSTASNPATGAPLLVINGNSINNITPLIRQDNVAPSVTTSTTSSNVFVNDTGSNVNSYTSVYVATHISVGGIIIFGFYQCTEVAPDQFQIALSDTLGNPVFPTSSVTNGGVVAQFTTTNNSTAVNVHLPNHGYSALTSTYSVLVATTLGGVTLFGNYTVETVVDANNFTIFASQSATSGASTYINGGLAQYDFYVTTGPLPQGTGFGVGGFGVGGFGSGVTPTQSTGAAVQAIDWTVDNLGGIFVSSPLGLQFGPDGTNPIGGPVYIWDPLSNTNVAQAIPQGPVCNNGIFVAMPQQQIVAWGSTFTGIQDPLLLRWCDVQNYNQWIAQTTNQAGSYRIPRGSRIVAGIQAPQQALIFTDLAVWSMQYIGQPYIYSFNEIGTGCGLIGPKAVGVFNGVVYWMSQNQFFVMAGSGVQPLYCPIWDQVFQELDGANVEKIRVAVNSYFNEIAWYYPVQGGNGENSAYVKFNTQINQWDYGTLSRSAWLYQSIWGPPIGADPNTLMLYQHETSNDAAGQPMAPYFQTGFFEIGDGHNQTFVDFVLPDMLYGMAGDPQNATVMLTLLVQQYPGDTPVELGPYTMQQATQYISTRLRGRLVAIRVSSNDSGTWWRLGSLRYRYMSDGRF